MQLIKIQRTVKYLHWQLQGVPAMYYTNTVRHQRNDNNVIG